MENPNPTPAIEAPPTAVSETVADQPEPFRVPPETVARRGPIWVDGEAASLARALPAKSEVGYLLLDLAGNAQIDGRNADQPLIPGSTVKIATAVAALQILGPEHRYLTELLVDGEVEDGVLDGDLILKGGGDPLLDVPDLIGLVLELLRHDIREINGRFIIEDSLLPRFGEIEPSQPLEAPYNPGISALSLSFNRVRLSWLDKDEFTVSTVPRLDEARFEQVSPKQLPPSRIELKVHEDGQVTWQLADRGARRSRTSLPVKDGGLHAGRVFADLAVMHGIELPSPVRADERSPDAAVLAVHESRPLLELARDMLWYSNNLMAELIGLSAAHKIAPEVSSLEASAEVLLQYFKTELPDVDWQGAFIDNHSGLSSKARMTPRQLVAILRHGWEHSPLLRLLPSSGWSGTLVRRFSEQDQALRIWAKTGAINYANALAGFLLSSSHGPAIFAVMVSDIDARTTYDALPRRTRETERETSRWANQAKAGLDDLVRSWLDPTPKLVSQR
ncbi:MAG: D-alanyl-D-alanine carboxypeptidase/D-alanyl-D-alanine endopeptidase [Geminicoccaceae bacterium]